MRAGICISGLLIFFSVSPLFSQYFIWGQDPAGIKWKQIETPHFRLIFPEDYTERATYLADVLEYAYPLASQSMGFKPRQVSVIIHNQTVVPNGFVSWAPSRMELFTNPPPGDGIHDWHERLAVHEFRHVVQVDMLNQGVTGFLAGIFGEHITGAAFLTFVPLWMIEGDAVVAETALTYGGRGRLPSFEQGLRAQTLDVGIHPYEKAFLGSFKDHVPNYYELGYQLVAAARLTHGPDFWKKVIGHVAHRPYTLSPFSLGLKRYGHVNLKEHYHQTFNMLDSAWTHQASMHVYTPYVRISPLVELYTNYRAFAFRCDSVVVALKTGMGDIPRVVELGLDGSEKLLFTPGFYNHDMFSMGGDLIAWSETRNDPRWSHRSWSEIHIYHTISGEKRQLTRGTRYFSPAVSADGSMIAAIEVTSDDRYALVVVDAHTGKTLYRWWTPDRAFLMQPAWHPNGDRIIAVARNEDGKSIIGIHINGQTFHSIFHAGHTEISNPRYLDASRILFNAAFSGINNIYLFDTQRGEGGKLISSRFGALDAIPSPGGEHIVWSDYSVKGYRTVMHEGDFGWHTAFDKVEDHSLAMYRILANQEGGIVTESNIPRQEHEVTDYSKWRTLFNFHSWAPFSLQLDNMDINPGVSVFSQNVLSTSVVNMGYGWDMNDQLGHYFLNYSYMGLYPELDMRAQSGMRRSWYTTSEQPDEPIAFLWREHVFKLGASIPLSFTRGQFFYGLRPSVRLGMTMSASSRDTPAFFQANRVYPLEYRLFGYWQVRSVARDIRPGWGQAAEVQFRHSPVGGTDMGSVLAGRIISYFPGLTRHHSFRLGAAFQSHLRGEPLQNRINYTFPNLILYPRGHDASYDDHLWVLSADYAYPIGYPEWVIPSLLYVRRLHMNLFADHGQARFTVRPEDAEPYERTRQLNSLGVDLVSDIRVLNTVAPIELGMRTIYIPDDRSFRYQLIFTLSIP